MVLCLFALPLFAILGIFSATYRQLAKEAFECVFKTVTFQPCNTGLDTRIKTSVVGPIFKRSEMIGKFVYRHFTMLSWFFVILSIFTVIGLGYGGYNYYLYGNCNGPSDTGFCVFDPTGANQQVSVSGLGECATNTHEPSQLQFSWFNASLYHTLYGSGSSPDVWMVGCYNCKYTRQTWPIIRELQREYNFTFVFAHLPLQEGDKLASRVGDCIKIQNPDLFWDFADAMFNAPINSSRSAEFVYSQVEKIGLDSGKIKACANSEHTDDLMIDETQNLVAVGIYGTPTIYVDGTVLVGPKPRRVYERLVD